MAAEVVPIERMLHVYKMNLRSTFCCCRIQHRALDLRIKQSSETCEVIRVARVEVTCIIGNMTNVFIKCGRRNQLRISIRSTWSGGTSRSPRPAQIRRIRVVGSGSTSAEL